MSFVSSTKSDLPFFSYFGLLGMKIAIDSDETVVDGAFGLYRDWWKNRHPLFKTMHFQFQPGVSSQTNG